jgi:hypothetical protein
VVAYGQAGRELARPGSRQAPEHPARSQSEAREQGDPAGFAPTAGPASSFSYQGRPISANEAARRGLACVEDDRQVRCFSSAAELDATEGGDQHGSAAPTATARSRQP